MAVQGVEGSLQHMERGMVHFEKGIENIEGGIDHHLDQKDDGQFSHSLELRQSPRGLGEGSLGDLLGSRVARTDVNSAL